MANLERDHGETVTSSFWPRERFARSQRLLRRSRFARAVWLSFSLFIAIGVAADEVTSPVPAEEREGLEFFEAKVRPLLHDRCLECHGAEQQEGGLRLDSKTGWQQGGERGTALIPGNPADSLLVRAVTYADKNLRMPPEDRLSAEEVELLREWIRRGAPDPRSMSPINSRPARDWQAIFRERLDWWSLQPIAESRPPEPRQVGWASDPVDQFILAALERQGLAPASLADSETLLRRLTFVLTGLPPTTEQHSQFLDEWKKNPSFAYERLVDQCLESPHFGERLARHWMDVVRYTDTYGYESDNPANGAFEYRDYLIRAFNGDVGFDQLLREQLAGDLLAHPRLSADETLNESQIGPMFYHLGENREGGSLMFNGIHQQMVDNRIDALSKAFLALTVACARCHDHKLEAVSQRDYYALAAVLMRPRWTSRVIDAPGRHTAALETLQRLRVELRQELAHDWGAAANVADGWRLDELASALDEKERKAIKLEDVGYPLVQLTKDAGADRLQRWNELASEWREARAARLTAHEKYQVLADFREPRLPDGWVWEGDGMQYGHVPDGTPLIALEGDAVIERVLARGYFTNSLSSKLPGALRMPPQHQVPKERVSLEIAGGEFAGYLTVQSNGFKSEQIGFFKSATPVWKTFADPALKNGVTGVTLEFATTALNPNFPPRIGLSDGLPYSDPGFDKRSWLGITRIVAHDHAETPPDRLEPFVELYRDPAPASAIEVEQRVSEWFQAAVRRWVSGNCRDGDVPILNWLLAHRKLPNRAAPESRMASLVSQYRQVEAALPFARTVTGMDERETRRLGYPLNVRGDVDVVGDPVDPDFLEMFAGRHTVAQSSGSGRLELTEALLRSDQPLTARVYANRLWQWVFGTGLVATPDDFGHLGERPSHPELLDYLASELHQNGWSTKRLVRRLVLSATFRQAGRSDERANEMDPGNRLLHHYPTRRLEAEAIRDNLLAVSGRFDSRLYGRPIDPPRTAEDTVNKRLLSGPLDGQGRRSLYLRFSIMEPPKFLVTFNLPDLKLPSGKRDVTSVPEQALLLLNDPFVIAMAKHWGAQLVKQPDQTPEDRIAGMFMRAFGRAATESERKRWGTAVRELSAGGDMAILTDEVAWSRLAQALFNASEFIYYR